MRRRRNGNINLNISNEPNMIWISVGFEKELNWLKFKANCSKDKYDT